MANYKFISVRIDNQLKEDLKALSSVLGIDESTVVRQAVRDLIDRLTADPDFRAKVTRHAERRARLVAMQAEMLLREKEKYPHV